MTLRSPTNASIRAWRRYFPLVSVETVTELFKEMLQGDDGRVVDCINPTNCPSSVPPSFEPNLVFISVILGYIESHITMGPAADFTQKLQPESRKRSAQGNRPSRSKRRSVKASSSLATKVSNSPAYSPSIASSTSETSTSAQVCTTPATPPSPSEFAESSVLHDRKTSLFVLRYEEAETLYQRFYSMITNDPKLTTMAKWSSDGKKTADVPEDCSSNRRLIKAVCDVLCANLSTGRQKEHLAHAQSIYSFIKYGILDSFGLAFTTVAACQLLGYSDVHLALSEDHAWVEFGAPGCRETADVSMMPALELCDAELTQAQATTSANDASLPPHAPCPPSIRLGHLLHSWIYLNGSPVVCNPLVLSVAAAVTAIQPRGLCKAVQAPQDHAFCSFSVKRPRVQTSSTASACDSPSFHTSSLSQSVEAISPQLVKLKQNLLWIVYRANLLSHYPLGLTSLAEIEEAYPSGVDFSNLILPYYDEEFTSNLPELVEIRGFGKPEPSSSKPADISLELLRRAVQINRIYFRNQHVYPYIYLANYLCRHGDLINALRNWAEAARVIGQYNHSSEDTEIYREFLDIATRVMPEMFKLSAMEPFRGSAPSGDSLGHQSATATSDPNAPPVNLLESPLCLAYLLAFYDHLCLWEEGSTVPVLHVGWVDKLMASLIRFPPAIRCQLHIEEANSPHTTASPMLPPSIQQHRHQLQPAITTRSSVTTAVCGTAPSPLPLIHHHNDYEPGRVNIEGEEEEAERLKKGGLTVLLPAPTAFSTPGSGGGGAGSSSTTSSSALSMFTPLASTGCASSGGVRQYPPLTDVSSNVAAEEEESELLAPPHKLSSSSTTLPPPLLDFLTGGGSDWDEVTQDTDSCCLNSNECSSSSSPKERIILRLVRASQFHLLNPAFLLGDLTAPPFVVSPEELEVFFQTKTDPATTGCDVDQAVMVKPTVPSPSNHDPASKSGEPIVVVEKSEEEIIDSKYFAVEVAAPIQVTINSEDVFTTDMVDRGEVMGGNVVDVLPPSPTSSPSPNASPSTNSPVANGKGAEETKEPRTERQTNISQPFTRESEETGEGDVGPKVPLAISFECSEVPESTLPTPLQPEGVYLRLYSTKMCRIAKLLNTPGCLKSSAIKLTLTAQSEVNFSRRRPSASTSAQPRSWRIDQSDVSFTYCRGTNQASTATSPT